MSHIRNKSETSNKWLYDLDCIDCKNWGMLKNGGGYSLSAKRFKLRIQLTPEDVKMRVVYCRAHKYFTKHRHGIHCVSVLVI